MLVCDFESNLELPFESKRLPFVACSKIPSVTPRLFHSRGTSAPSQRKSSLTTVNPLPGIHCGKRKTPRSHKIKLITESNRTIYCNRESCSFITQRDEVESFIITTSLRSFFVSLKNCRLGIFTSYFAAALMIWMS